MSLPHVIHLIDDTRPGGVMRVLDHIRNHGSGRARHELRVVARGALTAPALEADLIVSHLSVRWAGLPFLMGLRARNAARPILHVEHSYTAGFVAHRVPARGRFFTLLRTAYALFDRVVAVSAAQQGWLAARGLVEPGRLTLLRSAVDVAPFLALPGIGARPRVVGAIGRLDAQKGFDILIRAFRAVPDPELRLEVVGDGPERAALQALAAGDGRIRFHGHAADPVPAMAGVEVVAMPSRWEAYGLVALEARAAGRLVLCASVDGLDDHIRAGALPVGPGVADWTAALGALATTDPRPRCARMRARAADATAAFAQSWDGLIAEVTAAPARAA